MSSMTLRKYIDVHAWYFTPENAFAILSALLSLSRLGVHRLYSTRRPANEFWMIMTKFEGQIAALQSSWFAEPLSTA
jgi:hypothetical protein